MAQKRRLPDWGSRDPNPSPSSQHFLNPVEASTSSATAAEERSERTVPQKRNNSHKIQENSHLQKNKQIVQESRTPAKPTASSEKVNDSPVHLAKTRERITPQQSAYSGRSSDESEKKKGKEKATETRLGQKSSSPRGGDASTRDKEIAVVERELQADQHRGKQNGGSRKLQLKQDAVTPSPSHSNAKQALPPFSKLLDGVVFAISGLVNPERAELRTKALEMGASYQSDWNDDCTLLISAFLHTPKFMQVKAQGGTIVAKDWIIECYKQRKLVDMAKYLLFSGRRWRKESLGEAIDTGVEDDELWIPPGQIVEPEQSRLTNENDEDASLPAHGTNTKELGMETVTQHVKDKHFNNFSKVLEADDSEVQHWAHEDLQAITKWLQQQENKPDSTQLQFIAHEGLMTCLEDAIKSIQQNKGVSSVLESWAFVPRVIKELRSCEQRKVGKGKHSASELLKEAERLRSIYALAFRERGKKLVDAEGELGLEQTKIDEKSDDDDDATELISDDDSRDDLDIDEESTVIMKDDEVRKAKHKIISAYSKSKGGY